MLFFESNLSSCTLIMEEADDAVKQDTMSELKDSL